MILQGTLSFLEIPEDGTLYTNGPSTMQSCGCDCLAYRVTTANTPWVSSDLAQYNIRVKTFVTNATRNLVMPFEVIVIKMMNER